MPASVRSGVFAALPLVFALGAIDPSLASDMQTPMPAKAGPPTIAAWTYQATPYFWMPSIDGTATVKGRSVDIDATFIDLLHQKIPKELFGLMGAFEARNGRFALTTDLVYMKLGASGDAVRARSVHPSVGGSLSASISMQYEMVIAEAALAYELSHWRSATFGSGTSFDLYGGGRFWWQNAEASLALTAGLAIDDLVLSGGRAVAGSGDVTWFDPIVGARLRHQFSQDTELVLRGDVGGFGVGSELSWQAMGTFIWEFVRTQNAV